MDLDRLQEILGLELPDRDLVWQALTHSSYLNENPGAAPASNERLEFLGDAILGAVAAEYLYHTFPDLAEGELTSLRAAVVRGKSLAAWARELGLDSLLRLGKGEDTHGGRQRDALLGAGFEALLAAIYLQLGYEGARTALERFLPPAIESVIRRQSAVDAKSLFQQLCQGARQVTPSYRVLEVAGPAHSPVYTVAVLVDGEQMAVGAGEGKRAAEQAAAAEALRTISEAAKANSEN